MGIKRKVGSLTGIYVCKHVNDTKPFWLSFLQSGICLHLSVEPDAIVIDLQQQYCNVSYDSSILKKVKFMFKDNPPTDIHHALQYGIA